MRRSNLLAVALVMIALIATPADSQEETTALVAPTPTADSPSTRPMTRMA